jgi:hypothetical protein
MIVWVASYPRSGNTWFNIVLARLSDVPRADLYDVPPHARREFVSALGSVRTLHALKTHDLPAGDTFPAIYVVRDGRDALVSHAHFMLFTRYKVPVGADPPRFTRLLRRLITGQLRGGFGSWSDHVRRWTAHVGPAAVVRYEELIRDPVRVVRAAWQAASGDALRPQDVSLPTFDELHAREPWFYRKGREGAWRDEMSDELHALFWHHHGPAMHALGYGDASPPPRRTTWWRQGTWR